MVLMAFERVLVFTEQNRETNEVLTRVKTQPDKFLTDHSDCCVGNRLWQGEARVATEQCAKMLLQLSK